MNNPLAHRLQQMAKAIEAGEPTDISTVHHMIHFVDVTRDDTGDMIVDAQFVGQTMLISTVPLREEDISVIRGIIERGFPTTVRLPRGA